MVEVEELGGTATGYIVPHWEGVVRKESHVRAQFLVGADGHNSLVRQRLGAEYSRLGAPEFFAAYEFESDTPIEEEARVVLDDLTTNVLWPLPGNKNRWTFQVNRSELAAEFPEKERRSVRLEQKAVDERIRQYVQQVVRERAPWFSAGVREVTWCTEVFFEARLVKRFGDHRCWLAGDAAHQTGPVGAQSMNVGMLEAESLATRLRRILRDGAPPSSLEDYDQECQAEWRRLFGLAGGLKAGSGAAPWVATRQSRLLGCLPASGAELAPLARQLGLELA
jgi:3-(3-hydroxy-phenyl)propionate hydroxylase